VTGSTCLCGCTIDTVPDANSARTRLCLIRRASEWLSAPAVFRRTSPLRTPETSALRHQTSCSWQRHNRATAHGNATRIDTTAQSQTRGSPSMRAMASQPAPAASGPTTASDVITRMKQLVLAQHHRRLSQLPLRSQRCVMIRAALDRKVLSRPRITDDCGGRTTSRPRAPEQAEHAETVRNCCCSEGPVPGHARQTIVYQPILPPIAPLDATLLLATRAQA